MIELLILGVDVEETILMLKLELYMEESQAYEGKVMLPSGDAVSGSCGAVRQARPTWWGKPGCQVEAPGSFRGLRPKRAS